MSQPNLPPVLTVHWPDCRATSAQFLGAFGGFSGATFWRMETPQGSLRLRRFAWRRPDDQRLAWIHAVIGHVAAAGFPLVAVPCPTHDGGSFVRDGKSYWELSPWLPGAADFFTSPSPQRLAAAMRALAEFHCAAASYAPLAAPAPSPNCLKRLAMIERLGAGDLQRLAQRLSESDDDRWAILREDGQRLLDQFPRVAPEVVRQLTIAAEHACPLLPCLCDIHADHVLFSGNTVTGLLDYEALAIESPATDIARLAGSLTRDDPQAWRLALEAYQQARPLSSQELEVTRALNRSEVLLSGINWLEWIFVDNRQFDAPATVSRRFAIIRERFERQFGIS